MVVRDAEDCLSFDGSGDYAGVVASQMASISGEATLCLWVKFAGGQTYDAAFLDCQWGNDNAGGWQLYKMAGQNKWKGYAGGYSGRDVIVTSGQPFVPGRWYFISISKKVSSNRMTTYVNAVAVEQRTDCTFGMEKPANGYNLRFGGNRTGGSKASCSMRDVMIFNKELSLAEIQDIYYSNIIPSSLVHHWKMDEASGTVANDNKGGANASITGATWSLLGSMKLRSQAPSRIAIRDEEVCLYFLDNHCVQVSNPGINITEFSVSFNARTIWSGRNSGFNDWLSINGLGGGELVIETAGSSGKPAVYLISGFSGASQIAAVNGTELAGRGWKKFHLVASKSGNYVRLYLNATLIGSSSWNPSSEVISGIRIGSRGSALSRGINARMNRVRIYSQPLTPEEITREFYSDIVNTSKLIGQYLLNEGSGTVAIDTSGNGNNGVITGATWSLLGPMKLRSIV